MAEVVKVQVQAETKSAEDALRKAQQLADSLGKKQTTIRIKAEGIDGLAKQIRVVENETAKLALSADTFRALKSGAISATQAMEDMGARVNRVNTDMQSFIDHATGVSRETSQITAKTSMFGKISEDAFKALNSGAISANQVMEDMGTRVNRVNTEMQSFIDHATGVERETSQITAKTSMFGKISEDTFNAYTSGAITGEQATQTLSKGVETLGNETQETSGIFDTLTKRFTAANLVSAAVTFAISKLRQALREAVDEMKEMDKELTSIQIVTGMSDLDKWNMSRDAFSGAASQGRTVSDYLNAAERFARAGYRGNIKGLTELSLVIQNIGGVTEETASKFILAADAAWKMHGSAERLWTMLDGVSSIADQNATDIGKIAEAYTVAGSAFANAGESERTFAALIGTTTAATQRSGAEMARGLQTILFRVRQVKGELDDGEVINAEDISNAAKALDSVGISVLNDANELKSFSEIMGELSEKWDTLNSKQKSYLQNALAGNRRGNILFTLMDHWEDYEKMLAQFEGGEGTAAQKNAIYTESWAAASNKLKDSWTEFISIISNNGSVIISFLDSISSVFQDINYAIEPIGTLIEKLKELSNGSGFVKGAGKAVRRAGSTVLLGPADNLLQVTRGVAEIRRFFNRGEEIPGVLSGPIGAIKSYVDLSNEAANATKESTDAVTENEEALDSLDESVDNVGESEKETTKEVEELTNAFDKQKDKINAVSEAIKKERDDTIKAVADIYKAMNDAAEKGYYGSTAYRNGIKLLFGTDSRDKIKKEAKEAVDTYVKEIEKGDYSNAAANLWRKVADEDGNIRDSAGNIIASMEQVGDEFVWTFDKTGQGMDNFLKAMEDATGIGAGFWAAMMESFGMYTDALDNWIGDNTDIETNFVANTDEATKATEGYIGVIESVPTEVTTTYHAKYETDGESGTSGTVPRHAKGKRNGYSGISVVNDEYPADGSKPELIISRSTGRAYIANGGKPALVNLRHDDIVLTASETRSAMGGIPAFADGKEEDPYDTQNIDSLLTQVTTPADTTNNGGNGGGKKKPNPEKAWEELKKLIDYLIEHAENDLKEKLKVLDQQLAALEAEWKAQKEANELADKQLAVDNALLDLQKAQTERTVRYYNEETQQWEWMADQGSVNDAQKAYEDANKELADYLAEQEYERKREEIENRKNELQEQFDAMTDAWSEIVDAIEAPSGDLQQLLNTIMNNGSGTLLEQSGSIADLLNALSSGLFNSGYLDGLFKINGNTENSTTTADTTFDKGGFAYGRGFMRKGSETETVIGPDITSAILDPVKNERFSSFADSLRFMMGNESPIFKGQSNITNNNGGNYYVNGIKIGHDMAQMPFVEVMRTIAIHANETA